MLKSKQNFIHFGIHALLWLAFLSLPFIIEISDIGKLRGIVLFNYYLNFALDAVVFYVFYLYLFPKVLAKRKFKRFFLFSVSFIIVYSFLDSFIHRNLHILIYDIHSEKEFFDTRFVIGNVFKVTFFVILSAFARFTIDWFINIYEKEKIARQNLNSELNMLRLQISPHFLMNSLNNIYSLVLKKSDEAPDALLKLSEIMRYMLYDANIEKMTLDKEIPYLSNYIDLQMLRLKNKEYAKINIDIKDDKKKIAPLILIPFIENAFKHGSRSVDEDCILIDIKLKENWLHFIIKNHMPPTILNKDNSGGIGLENVKRRLELIYPKKHTLKISTEESIFSVDLKLELS